jgi:hypothetical protein
MLVSGAAGSSDEPCRRRGRRQRLPEGADVLDLVAPSADIPASGFGWVSPRRWNSPKALIFIILNALGFASSNPHQLKVTSQAGIDRSTFHGLARGVSHIDRVCASTQQRHSNDTAYLPHRVPRSSEVTATPGARFDLDRLTPPSPSKGTGLPVAQRLGYQLIAQTAPSKGLTDRCRDPFGCCPPTQPASSVVSGKLSTPACRQLPRQLSLLVLGVRAHFAPRIDPHWWQLAKRPAPPLVHAHQIHNHVSAQHLPDFSSSIDRLLFEYGWRSRQERPRRL